MIRIAVPNETSAAESRVALVPDLVKALSAQGHEIRVEPGASAVMLPGRLQTAKNAILLLAAVAPAVVISAGTHEVLFIIILVAAAALGNAIVLPIGGADMPVVISLLNAFTLALGRGDPSVLPEPCGDRAGIWNGRRSGPAAWCASSPASSRRGVSTRGFAMHPVAGRMPGHMNVLLAEADVP